jgi:hypothetical protein
MPGRVRGVFGIVSWVIAGLFLQDLCILSFINPPFNQPVNQPAWLMKITILGIFLALATPFLLIAGWCRGFGRFGRELGIALLSVAGASLLIVLMMVCMFASPETAKSMPPNFREMFSAIWFGIACLTFYVVFGLILLLQRRGRESETNEKAI